MPMSRSIHGNAFSCPMARMTSSAGRKTVSTTVDVALPLASSVHSRRSNSIPFSLPSSTTKRFGEWLTTISISSSSASSSSQGEALKNWRGRRAMTLMSLPPRRRDVRQQSMAVLPTPMMRTRSPIALMCSKATLFQPVDADVDPVARLPAAGEIQILAAGRARAHEHGVEFALQQSFQAGDRGVVANVDAHVEDHLDLFVQDLFGQAKRRNVGAHQAAGLGALLEHDDFVAKRNQIVGHREGRGPGPDAGDALAVLVRGAFGS